jgi:hypothetical protein
MDRHRFRIGDGEGEKQEEDGSPQAPGKRFHDGIKKAVA